MLKEKNMKLRALLIKVVAVLVGVAIGLLCYYLMLRFGLDKETAGFVAVLGVAVVAFVFYTAIVDLLSQ